MIGPKVNVHGTYAEIWNYLDGQDGNVVILRNYFRSFLDHNSPETAHSILLLSEFICQELFANINDDKGTRYGHIPYDIAVKYFAHYAKGSRRVFSESFMTQHVGSWSEYVNKKKLERSQKPSSPTPPTTPTTYINPNFKEEPPMSNAAPIKPVESKVYFYGKESKDVSDQDIFNKISNLEASVSTLEKIQSKPKKLVDQINAIKAEIKECVNFCDTRVVE